MVLNSVYPNTLIVISGPTASGKTELSLSLAKFFNAEIISCDSRQFYREMNIGTAKPTESQFKEVLHHFINSHSIEENYSAGDYEKDVLSFLENYFKKNKIAILTGGSGLFMRIVCEGVDEYPEVPEIIRQELKNNFLQEGIESLQRELKEKDPIYYEKVDNNNPQRLIRALEVCRASGKTFSSFHGKTKPKRFFNIIKVALDWDRELLYDRINRRVDYMISSGLEKEAKSLYPYKHLNSLQTVGYQEFFDYFDEKITKEEAISKIKQNSRNYAKRQLTWLRKEKDLYWYKMPSNNNDFLFFVKSLLRQEKEF